MKVFQLVFAFPFALALGVVVHALLGRVLKAVLWSWSPLATGEPEAAVYERRVYPTADMPMMQIVVAAALSGLPWWLAFATGSMWWCAAGVVAMAGVQVLDVMRWERVAVSAHNLWFQRGYRARVHQVVMDNIRDASIEETEAHGFTLRHGRENRLVRLNVRMKDKRVVALPKTGVEGGGLQAVQAVAEHLRVCLHRARQQQSVLPRASAKAPASPEDEDLRRALQRLRQGAALKKLAR